MALSLHDFYEKCLCGNCRLQWVTSMLLAGLLRLQQLFDEIVREDIPLQVKVYKVNDAKHAYSTLIAIDNQKLDGNGDKRVLLDMPTDMCEELLVSQKIDARRNKFHYFITNLVCHLLYSNIQFEPGHLTLNVLYFTFWACTR